MTDHAAACPRCGSAKPPCGIEMIGLYDGVLAFQCAACDYVTPRFTPPHYLAEKSERAARVMNARDAREA